MHKLYEQVSVALGRAMTLSREDLKRENGQGAVEYALVVLGVAAIIALAVAGFTGEITKFMSKAGAKLGSYIS
jgi:Flp pilus assembly pilin Flp